MITQKQLQTNLAIRDYNSKIMCDTLKKVNDKITKQGDGCYNEHGPAYYDPLTKHRDSIAIISTIPAQFLIKPYHCISSFESRSILTNIFRVCKFDIVRDAERARVTNSCKTFKMHMTTRLIRSLKRMQTEWLCLKSIFKRSCFNLHICYDLV